MNQNEEFLAQCVHSDTGVCAQCFKYQSEIARLKEELKDIEIHSQQPFTGEEWLNYCNDAARKALEAKP